ncbi:MAG: carboxypeptidase-like regulatory domain-containing protein [Kiritimatiellales bacterium]
MKQRYLLILIVVGCLNGCQMFYPCHSGTWATGTVTDLKDLPIGDATVSIYGSERKTKSDGTFSFALADALPFSFVAKANGYQPIQAPSRTGHFVMAVRLAPTNSHESSQVVWKKISGKEFQELLGTPTQSMTGTR